jgi:hypothetical protein
MAVRAANRAGAIVRELATTSKAISPVPIDANGSSGTGTAYRLGPLRVRAQCL